MTRCFCSKGLFLTAHPVQPCSCKIKKNDSHLISKWYTFCCLCCSFLRVGRCQQTLAWVVVRCTCLCLLYVVLVCVCCMMCFILYSALCVTVFMCSSSCWVLSAVFDDKVNHLRRFLISFLKFPLSWSYFLLVVLVGWFNDWFQNMACVRCCCWRGWLNTIHIGWCSSKCGFVVLLGVLLRVGIALLLLFCFMSLICLCLCWKVQGEAEPQYAHVT